MINKADLQYIRQTIFDSGITTYARLRRNARIKSMRQDQISEMLTMLEQVGDVLILLGKSQDTSSNPEVYYASQALLERIR